MAVARLPPVPGNGRRNILLAGTGGPRPAFCCSGRGA